MKNIIRFVLLLLLQVFVLNKVLIHEFVNPYLYLLFVLLLPFSMPRAALLLCGLLMGLTLDMFMNTPGMHAAACVLIAFLRPFIINLLAPQGGFDLTQKDPSVTTMGWVPFTVYATILVLVHHIAYFALEVYGFSNPLYFVLKTLLSAAVSLGLILVFEMLFAVRPGK
ncbi:rod shape-determining protein MreD [Compostibacter hankyongensis]